MKQPHPIPHRRHRKVKRRGVYRDCVNPEDFIPHTAAGTLRIITVLRPRQ